MNPQPNGPAEAEPEEFSLPLFVLTVLATLAGLLAGLRLFFPGVWTQQLIAAADPLPDAPRVRSYTRGEEIANWVTHGIGLLMGIAGLTLPIVVALQSLVAVVPNGGLWLLVAGGLCYTVGVVFYLWRRLRYHHAVWHAFVLGGSTCHFLAVFLFLLPRAA